MRPDCPTRQTASRYDRAVLDSTGTFGYVTAAIAVLGLLLATASLVWQVRTWGLAGSVVQVEIGQSMEDTPNGLIRVLKVTARNVGRLGIEINEWGLRVDVTPEMNVSPSQKGWGTPLPAKLDPGHSAVWLTPSSNILALLEHNGIPDSKVHGFVALGTGEKRESDQGVLVR